MRKVLAGSLVSLLAASICCAQITDVTPKQLTLPEAIQLVNSPAGGFWNMSPFSLQVHYRLQTLLRYHQYKFADEHAAGWKAALQSDKQTDYGKMCAAFFLLDKDQEARKFIQARLASTNLRHRYNAAEVLSRRLAYDKATDWDIDTLIGLLKDGSLDGNDVRESPAGDFPQGDGDDIMFTPLDTLCRQLGWRGAKRAVPALISVLERLPVTDGASDALGELQDKRGIPILMKVLQDRSSYMDAELLALAKFKHKEAVPIILVRLGEPAERTFFDPDRNLLEALLEIGDPRAVAPIEKFLIEKHDEKIKAAARRVLVQLSKPDPVPGLLELLDRETYEYEQWNLIRDLAKHGGERVRVRLTTIATESKFFSLRRAAIRGLGTIGDQSSLLVLASLLELQLPKDLKGDWKVGDHQREFLDLVEETLAEKCQVNFGQDRVKWETWIKANRKS